MARSKCLDNLRRKRNLRVTENRRYILNNGGSEAVRNREEEPRGVYVSPTFADKNTSIRPSSITKARKELYNTTFHSVPEFKLPAGAKRLPRKLKKQLKNG